MGQAREAMGGHGRPWEAMGSVTFGLDIAIGTGSGGHGRPREATGGHGIWKLGDNFSVGQDFGNSKRVKVRTPLRYAYLGKNKFDRQNI